MKFEKAMEMVFDKTAENHSEAFALNSALTAIEMNIATKVWNAIAFALAEKGLDDFVIVRNNSIISIPFKDEEEEKPEDEKIKKGTGKSPKSETATKHNIDVKEKESEDKPE